MPITPGCQSSAHSTYAGSRTELCDLTLRLPRDSLFDGPALGVDRIQFDRDLPRTLGVVCEEQLESGIGSPDPAGGVDPRRQAEAEGVGVDRARVDPSDAHQRSQAGPRGAREGCKPLAHQPAVLALERHQIRHRRQRDKLDLVLDARSVERLCELEGDAGSAQLGARIAAHAGMDDRTIGEQLVGARRVVVADDHVQPRRPGGGDLVDGCDPAVDRDQQARSTRREPLDGRHRQAVAVFDPVGQEPPDVRAEGPQRGDHDRGGADAVDVVVAVHGDPGPGRDVALDQCLRPLNARKLAPVVPFASLEEGPRQRLGRQGHGGRGAARRHG